MKKKFFLLVVFVYIFCVPRLLSQNDPCGEILYWEDTLTNYYPPNFLDSIATLASSFTGVETIYGINDVDYPDGTVPCKGDIINLFPTDPNHHPLEAFFYPNDAFTILGDSMTLFQEELIVDESGIIVLTGHAIGEQLDTTNYMSIIYIPVNQPDTTTLQKITCDPDSSGFMKTEILTGQCGCDSLVITHFLYEPFEVNISGPGDICEGETLTLAFQTNQTYSSILWSTGDTTETISILEGGNYGLTLTNENACIAITNWQVEGHPIPIAAAEGSGGCEGDSGLLVLEDGGAAVQWEWTLPSGGTRTGQSLDLSPEMTSAGLYIVTITDEFGCTNTDSARVEIYPLPDLPDIIPSDTLCFGQEIMVNNLSDSIVYSWSRNGIDVPLIGDTTLVISHQWRGRNTLTAISPDGCISTANFDVEVLNCNTECEDYLPVFVPNTFSPNGDGINDVIYPMGDPNAPYWIKEFSIFNRWGALVHQAKDFPLNNYQSGWGSVFLGKDMKEMVFVYFAEVENTITGDVCIIKGGITVLGAKVE